MQVAEVNELLTRINDLETRLLESEQLIEAIRAGEVDAFAISENNSSEVYTLKSGDYAYRVLIEEFGEGAINVTEEGLIVYANPYFYDLIKLPYSRVIGSYFNDFIHQDSLDTFNELFKKSLKGKSKGEINLSVDDSIIPVYVSLTSLQPKLATVGIVLTDLTEKKRHEETILKYQRDLELNNQELLNRNNELASFAYIASHDLQEPLRKIQIFTARLVEKDSNILSEKGLEYFTRIQAAAKRMQALINDLLTYSRTNILERKFELIELNSVIDEVKIDLQEQIDQKNAIIDSNCVSKIKVIPFQINQLILNLLSNSLKFSSPDRASHIVISCKIEKGIDTGIANLTGDKEYCHLSIADNGIGFESQYSEKIFEVFQRLHTRSEYSGTGIGLAIVKKIVENHNGIISAKGVPDKGAVFDIYLPV